MSHAIQKSYIRSGFQLQKDIRHPGGMRHAWIGYYHDRTGILGPVNPAGENRMIFCQIRSDDEYALGIGEIPYGIGHSGCTQSAVQANYRGCMAQSGAAVHVLGAQNSRELLNQVVLLIGALGGGKKADAVRTILLQGSAQTLGYKIQGFIPGYFGPAVSMSL
jgi:hypothetical protein